jgi:hypothetical protein
LSIVLYKREGLAVDESVRSIAIDAVLRRRMKVFGERAVTVFNIAAEELLESGDAGIAAIQVVIREMVLSAKSLDEFTVLHDFPGLLDTLVVYFRLMDDKPPDVQQESLDFLRSLRGEVLVGAIGAICSIYAYQKSPKIMPQYLITFLREVSKTDRGRAGRSAKSLMVRYERLTNPRPGGTIG